MILSPFLDQIQTLGMINSSMNMDHQYHPLKQPVGSDLLFQQDLQIVNLKWTRYLSC
jgi:hypothetical protein